MIIIFLSSVLEVHLMCFVWLSDLGTSDDSSLSDSVVQDEGKPHCFPVEFFFFAQARGSDGKLTAS